MNRWLPAFFIFALSHSTYAQEVYGLFMIVKGDVSYKNPRAGSEKAKVGAKVFEGAVITSEKDSRAKIVMVDRNVFNVAPETKMTIQKYESGTGKKNVSLSLEQGKVRVNVEQKYDGQKEKFLLKTPTVVAGVRGTQFLASYDSAVKTSGIVTFQGAVAMTSFTAIGQPISTVRVEKGQSSIAEFNRPPNTPQTLPKQELKDLDRSTSSTGAGNGPGPGAATAEGGAKLTNSRDVDSDNAKEIRVTPDAGAKPQTFAPPPPPPRPPLQQTVLPIPPTTKVIIHVQ